MLETISEQDLFAYLPNMCMLWQVEFIVHFKNSIISIGYLPGNRWLWGYIQAWGQVL